MTRKEIGAILRRLRKQAGLNPNEVGERIGLKGKTIQNYESGLRQPDAETFLKLCDIYEVVDVMAEFLGRSKGMLLSDHEIELVQAYRQAPAHQFSVDCLLNINVNEDTKQKHA